MSDYNEGPRRNSKKLYVPLKELLLKSQSKIFTLTVAGNQNSPIIIDFFITRAFIGH